MLLHEWKVKRKERQSSLFVKARKAGPLQKLPNACFQEAGLADTPTLGTLYRHILLTLSTIILHIWNLVCFEPFNGDFLKCLLTKTIPVLFNAIHLDSIFKSSKSTTTPNFI